MASHPSGEQARQEKSSPCLSSGLLPTSKPAVNHSPSCCHRKKDRPSRHYEGGPGFFGTYWKGVKTSKNIWLRQKEAWPYVIGCGGKGVSLRKTYGRAKRSTTICLWKQWGRSLARKNHMVMPTRSATICLWTHWGRSFAKKIHMVVQ